VTPGSDGDIPLLGVLAAREDLPRGWVRSMAIASRKLDALLAHDLMQIDRSNPREMHAWSLHVPLDGAERRVDAEFLVGMTTSISARSLRINSGSTRFVLTLDLHEDEHPTGWTSTRDVSWREGRAVLDQYASLLRRLVAAAPKTMRVDVGRRVARAETISRAMDDGGSSWVRMPWSFGDGIVSGARTLKPGVAIPDPWRGERMTIVKAESDSKGLMVTLSPIDAYVSTPSALEAMRAVNSLPPLVLAA
jgi:hypothetical protein